MDVRLTCTDCDEAGDYVVPNVLSPRDLVSRTDMDETGLHTTQRPDLNIIVSAHTKGRDSLKMSLVVRKPVFGGFRPGPTQTGLCSHSRWLES